MTIRGSGWKDWACDECAPGEDHGVLFCLDNALKTTQPDERTFDAEATEVLDAWHAAPGGFRALGDLIAAALRRAYAAERERAAKIADLTALDQHEKSLEARASGEDAMEMVYAHGEDMARDLAHAIRTATPEEDRRDG